MIQSWEEWLKHQNVVLPFGAVRRVGKEESIEVQHEQVTVKPGRNNWTHPYRLRADLLERSSVDVDGLVDSR